MIQDILRELIYNEVIAYGINIVHEEVKFGLMEANKHFILLHLLYILMVLQSLPFFSKHSLG